jgi:hypothetical protein
MHPSGSLFILIEKRGVWGDLKKKFGVPKHISYNPFVFTPTAQWLFITFQLVPQVPNIIALYHICFAQSPPLLNYI